MGVCGMSDGRRAVLATATILQTLLVGGGLCQGVPALQAILDKVRHVCASQSPLSC